MALPVRVSVRGLPPALSQMYTVVFCEPRTVGAKVAVMLQDWPLV
jgi:hypothetical protein